MKVCGFTIIRNAQIFDYPVVESIQSVLPLCDAFIVSVGKSEDNTLDLIRSIGSDKIRIIESEWDMSLREGGKLLAVETNKAFDAIPPSYDWAFYIQSDEVVHEEDYPLIRKAMRENLEDTCVEGLLFDYLHFYGSYDWIGASRKWYRHEVRIIRNDKAIRSYRDAQGFRKNGAKLKVKKTGASIYHYGWVKHPAHQQAKQEHFNKLWHNDEWIEKNIPRQKEYNYERADILECFTGTHPAVMKGRIAEKNWHFEYRADQYSLPLKLKISYWIEKKTNWRPFEYKNYILL